VWCSSFSSCDAVVCPDAARFVSDGDELSINLDEGRITVNGREFAIAPVPQFMRDMLGIGGLVE
jgi:3-isopropylmalate dehydratase small subunit